MPLISRPPKIHPPMPRPPTREKQQPTPRLTLRDLQNKSNCSSPSSGATGLLHAASPEPPGPLQQPTTTELSLASITVPLESIKPSEWARGAGGYGLGWDPLAVLLGALTREGALREALALPGTLLSYLSQSEGRELQSPGFRRQEDFLCWPLGAPSPERQGQDREVRGLSEIVKPNQDQDVDPSLSCSCPGAIGGPLPAQAVSRPMKMGRSSRPCPSHDRTVTEGITPSVPKKWVVVPLS